MGIEDMGYRLKVTAGPDYDPQTHQIVQVNADKTLRIENEHSIVSACVRVQDYDGMPLCLYDMGISLPRAYTTNKNI